MLTVVTVLYRSAEVLARTLPTWVGSATGLPVEFVFVDNAPDAGTEKLIAECLGDTGYTYLPDPFNPGFASGCNRGVAAATGDHVLLLNPDVWLGADSLTRILDAVAAHPDAPIAVGLVMGGETHVGIDLHPVSLFVDRAAGTVRGPLGPSGGAAVVPTALYRRFGGFDEEMFAWGEDVDLALRLYAAGHRTYPLDLALPHAWGHSVSGDRELGRFRAFLLARNRVLVGARAFSPALLLLGLPLAVAAHAALAMRKARQRLLRPFLAGVLRGLRQAPAARRRWHGPRFGVRDLVAYWRAR